MHIFDFKYGYKLFMHKHKFRKSNKNNMKCKICENTNALKEYRVKEMMFGFRDEFLYFQCGKCGCLQIAEIPNNMEKYYPSNYYSYSEIFYFANSKIVEILKKKRDNYVIFKKGLLGKLIDKYIPSNNVQLKILSEIQLTRNSKILDVGCGKGNLLLLLQKNGFKNLVGVDPYIENDIEYENGLKIHKESIYNIKEKKDLIMFHHCFEHLSDPLETLQAVSNLLNDGGYCIIRIPTVSSYAWKHYKENWVQLDAPRHFFLHSKESINYLAKKVSLVVEKVVYDSTSFQFLGSERYMKNIPLHDDFNTNESIFSTKEVKSFELRANELNINEEGDACAFIIRKG